MHNSPQMAVRLRTFLQRVTLRACGVCEDLALAGVQKNTKSASTHSFRRNSIYNHIINKVSFSLEGGHFKQNTWFQGPFRSPNFGARRVLPCFYLHFGNYLFGILSSYFESKVGSKRQNQDIDGRRAATEPVLSATGP